MHTASQLFIKQLLLAGLPLTGILYARKFGQNCPNLDDLYTQNKMAGVLLCLFYAFFATKRGTHM